MATMQKQQGIISFLDREDRLFTRQKPFYSNVPFSQTPGAEATNIKAVQHEVSIANVRGFENELSLDRNGFELVKLPTSFNSWQDGRKLVKDHYPECEQYLREKLGASQVIVYDHTLRSSSIANLSHHERQYFAPPSSTAHIDLTPEAARNSIREQFGLKADSLLKARHRIVNIWRPISEPVEQRPLALCDYRTALGDGVATDLVFPHTVTEIYTLGYSPRQQWYYVDRQMMDEVWLIKMTDSDALEDPTIAMHTPNTSFEHPGRSTEPLKPRQSIEIRAYVFG